MQPGCALKIAELCVAEPSGFSRAHGELRDARRVPERPCRLEVREGRKRTRHVVDARRTRRKMWTRLGGNEPLPHRGRIDCRDQLVGVFDEGTDEPRIELTASTTAGKCDRRLRARACDC